jgi:hypothetical protein
VHVAVHVVGGAGLFPLQIEVERGRLNDVFGAVPVTAEQVGGAMQPR